MPVSEIFGLLLLLQNLPKIRSLSAVSNALTVSKRERALKNDRTHPCAPLLAFICYLLYRVPGRKYRNIELVRPISESYHFFVAVGIVSTIAFLFIGNALLLLYRIKSFGIPNVFIQYRNRIDLVFCFIGIVSIIVVVLSVSYRLSSLFYRYRIDYRLVLVEFSFDIQHYQPRLARPGYGSCCRRGLT